MILVDTSVWIDHFRSADVKLTKLLNDGMVLAHPYIVGELALGNFRNRNVILRALLGLPQARTASNGDVLRLIEKKALFGTGIGYVDAHLLAAAGTTHDCTIWTRDKHFQAAAVKLKLVAQPRQP